MTNIEQSGGRNSRRHMHSGLAGIRPDSMKLGSVEHTVEKIQPYTAIDQLVGQSNRMVITKPHQPGMHKAKNNWTGR